MVTEILYQKVARDLKRQILAGHYPVGQLIPTENELESQYQVSKVTIRKAVEVLAAEGYLQKKSGIGTRVISNNLFNKLSKAESYTTIISGQGTLTKEVLAVKTLPADATPLASQTTGSVVYLQRRYLLDGAPLILVEHYLPNQLIQSGLAGLRHKSLYKILQENGQTVSRFKDEFRATLIDATSQKLLAKTDQLAMQRIRRGYGTDQQLIEYSVAIYDTEKFPYQIDYEV